MDVGGVVKSFDEAKDVIITWFSVLTRGPDAFEQIDLGTSSTLFYALRFTLYMSFVSFLLHIPTIAKFDLKNVAFVQPILIVETYIEYLAAGLILYGSMKLFGGKGSLQACTAAYCFLTAYLPIIAVLMLPAQMLVVPSMRKSPDYPDAIRILYEQLQHLSAWQLSGLLLSWLLTTVVFVVFFAAVFRAFRALHKLNRARAVSAFVLGLLASVVFNVFFLERWISAILS